MPLGDAEPRQRAGADAFEVAAEWRQRQPNAQHALTAIAGFELQRSPDFDELGAQCARAGFEQPGGLHRQRRTSGDHAAAADELGGGTCQSERVDAGVVPKAAVFDGDQ
jgi:hypothetical protein